MRYFFLIVVIALHLTGTAIAQNFEPPKFTVASAPEWTDLFYRSSGWFGGDGIFTIPLNGIESASTNHTKTLIVFSDTMIGDIINGKLQPKSKMIHNSIAILDGNKPVRDQLHFYWKTSQGFPKAIFSPNTPKTGSSDYYWLGDGFVNQELNNSIFIFGLRVKTISDDAFGFQEVGNTLIKVQADQALPYYKYEQKDTPFFIDKGNREIGSFGLGIFVNTKQSKASKPDGYIYVYGVVGKDKKLLVSRVKPKDFEDYQKWTFWDGGAWTSKMESSAAITNGISNELSISELPDGRYALIFQENGLGRNVCMRIGSTPFGPFGPVMKIWDTSEAIKLKGFYTYNAKAHPSLSAKGELLISYNVNSFNFFEDLKIQPNLYRPRFIKMKFE
jgi:hypothetical protein